MSVESKQCFFPSGDLDVEMTPCLPNEKDSYCCGNADLCLANGLCQNKDKATLGRGTCTDRTWNSPNCPQYCIENEYNGFSAKNFSIRHPRIWPCSNNQPKDGGLMCCDIAEVIGDQRDRSCCSGAAAMNLFTIGSKLGSATKIIRSSLSMSSQPSSRVSGSSIVVLSFPSSATLSLIQLPGPNPAFSSSLGLRSSPTSSLVTSNLLTYNNSSSNGSKIAIAVSTSVGAVFLIIASFYLYQRRRKSRRAFENSQVEENFELKDWPQELSGPQEFELSAPQEFELSAPQEFELSPGSKDQRPELPE